MLLRLTRDHEYLTSPIHAPSQALPTLVPDSIKTIISWTMDYLREHVINWIREQGGWVSSQLTNEVHNHLLDNWDCVPDACCLLFMIFFKEGIRSHFGTPTWQTVGVFLAGVLTTVIVIRKMWGVCEEQAVWKMRGTTTKGNVDGNKSMKEQLKESRKKFWQSDRVEQLVFGHVSA